MIWQEDVKQVIMLTNLMEGIKVNNNIKSLNDHIMSFTIILETYWGIIHSYFLVEVRAVLAKFTNNFGVR